VRLLSKSLDLFSFYATYGSHPYWRAERVSVDCDFVFLALSRRLLLRRTSFPLLVFTLLLAFAPKAHAWWMWTPGDTVDNVGYAPTKPVPFSHKTPGGDLKFLGQFCLSGARRSRVGGTPPLNTCMGCHKIVGTDLEPIKKLTESYKANKPIEWVK